VGAANAADPSSATPSWSGVYVGANIGYGWDSGDPRLAMKPAPERAPPDFPVEDIQGIINDLNAAGSFPTSLSPSAHGIVGGGQVGYNWQLPSDWVVGFEADLQASGIKGSETQRLSPLFFDETSTTVSKKVDWYGTVRARAGYLVNPQWLVYATGGLAYGKTSLGFHVDDLTQGCDIFTICGRDSASDVRVGWTLGGGVETMVAPNWSVKAEYSYVDLGKQTFDAATTVPVDFKVSAKYHEQIVRIGLNYHFN
jgi:outer membrane immunogenic protein